MASNAATPGINAMLNMRFDTTKLSLFDRHNPSPSCASPDAVAQNVNGLVTTRSVGGPFRDLFRRPALVENRDGFRDAPRDRFLENLP